MPENELSLLKSNIKFSIHLVSIANTLKAQSTPILDVDDLYRAALVQGVSAFDHFVHEEVRARIILIYRQMLPTTAGFKRFKIPISLASFATDTSRIDWLNAEIRRQHGHLTFQQPEKVADALRIVTDIELWKAVADDIDRTAQDIKIELKLIIDRRNKIAHEADIDPSDPATRYHIDSEQVTSSLVFIKRIAESISKVI